MENDHLYKKIKPLMGGFHQIRVRQRLISKRHGDVGYQRWFVEAGVIKENSAKQSFEGKHYYRCMRLLNLHYVPCCNIESKRLLKTQISQAFSLKSMQYQVATQLRTNMEPVK